MLIAEVRGKIIKAIKNDDAKELSDLLEQNEKAIDMREDGNTLAHLAVTMSPGEKCLRVLLARKPKLVDQKNYELLTPLHLAISLGKIDAVRRLLTSNPNLEMLTGNGQNFWKFLDGVAKKQVEIKANKTKFEQEVVGIKLDPVKLNLPQINSVEITWKQDNVTEVLKPPRLDVAKLNQNIEFAMAKDFDSEQANKNMPKHLHLKKELIKCMPEFDYIDVSSFDLIERAFTKHVEAITETKQKLSGSLSTSNSNKQSENYSPRFTLNQ